LAYKNLSETFGGIDQIVNATYPRARKAVKQIYLEGLDQYMQWFPWSWFSNMQFIGAGGFSAVYSAHMSPPYDIEPIKVSLKVVDDKILNEVNKSWFKWYNHFFLKTKVTDISSVKGIFTFIVSRFDSMRKYR
jgi:hypothetical protein